MGGPRVPESRRWRVLWVHYEAEELRADHSLRFLHPFADRLDLAWVEDKDGKFNSPLWSSCSIAIMFSGLTDTGTSFIRRSMFSLRYVG